jgi:hypothetical protein
MAYYSRNNSFSRSFNADLAEKEGRHPRGRAAAALGVSIKAFDAGCDAAGYCATEWHHVGKYAACIDYYDVPTLRENPEFWRGAAGVYKSAAKRADVFALAERALANAKAGRIAEFREMLILNRDCTRRVARRDTKENWRKFCAGACRAANAPVVRVQPGDHAGLQLAIEKAKARRAERQQATGRRAAKSEAKRAAYLVKRQRRLASMTPCSWLRRIT